MFVTSIATANFQSMGWMPAASSAYVAPATHDPQVLELAGRVTLLPNLPAANSQESRLRIILTDGRILKATRSAPPGWLRNPTPIELIVDKFWRNVHFSATVTQDQAARALDLVQDLENVPNSTDLVAALSLTSVTVSV